MYNFYVNSFPQQELDRYWPEINDELRNIDLRQVPLWVRCFFHCETLREAIAVRNILIRHRQWFLLCCLLGILHHWRPGFLSYPSSHTVPYLKDKIYPRSSYPELYSYREVYSRLIAKIRRAYKRAPNVNRKLTRKITQKNASSTGFFNNGTKVSAIITSPPYMNSLSYARDNRLRLWFLGVDNHKTLEAKLSPKRTDFLSLMKILFPMWSKLLVKDGACVLVLGAVNRNGKYHDLPSNILDLVQSYRSGLKIVSICKNEIPDIRRVRINCRSTREETILVFRKGK